MTPRISLLSVALAVCTASPLAAQTPVTWNSPVKVTASTTALTKSSGCDGCADAGAHSAAQLTGDGYAEFVLPSPAHLFAGLGADLGASTSASTINYAFNLQAGRTWEIRELGTYRKDGAYAAGDRFRVAVENGAVVYRRNGAVVYTSKIAPPFPLVLDVTIYSLGGSLNQAVTATAGAPDNDGGSGDAGGSGTSTTAGPYRAITDRTAYPKPALPAVGAAGSVINDPVFHTPIRRITDNLTRPGAIDRSYRTPSSPHQNAWSVNSSYFYVMGSGGGGPIPYAFDPSTGVARRIQPAATGDGGLVLKFYIEPQFSYVSDSIIYGSYSGSGSTRRTIDQYDFSTGQYTKLMDLDTLVGGLSGTYIGGVASSGGPAERLEAFFGGTSQDHHHYVLVFDRANPQNRQILDTWTSTINGKPAPIMLNFSLHHAMIDRSGRFVMLYTTSADQSGARDASQEYLWDTQTGAVTDMTDATHPYGHDAFGYGVLVNKDCCTSTSWDAGQWQFRALASPLAPRDLITQILSPKETYLSDHTTWNNARPDRLTPVVSSLYRFGSNTTQWRAWDDEIIAIQTDAPGANATVWRFAHHRSDVSYDGDPSRTAFWYQPLPNVSQDGKWILFMSNWEKTLGTDVAGEAGTGARQDVFMLALQATAPPVVPVAIAGPAVPAGRVGVPYTLTLTATGGSGAYVWSAQSLPAGLSLNAGTGAITGAPTAIGTFAFDVTVTDAADAGNHATVHLTAPIGPAPITVMTTSLPRVRATQQYGAALQAAGGGGTAAWSLDQGALPAGISLDASTGALSGTSTAVGSVSFVVRVTDASDSTNTATGALSITIDPSPVQLTAAALASGRATLPYSATVAASGGTGNYAWSIASGTLPTGVNLDSAGGSLTGTPSSAGTSTFTVRVTDTGDSTNVAVATFSIAIGSAPVAVTASTLPPVRLGVAYAAAVSATGGSGTVTWTIVSGSLPPGISLNTTTGALTGAPTTMGTFAFAAAATDVSDATNCASAAFSISVGAAPLTIATTALPSGREHVAYASTVLQGAGGGGAFIWSATGLAGGLSVNVSTGAITGTPTVAGVYTVAVKAVDASDASNVATATYTVPIAAAIKITSPRSLPDAAAGAFYSFAVAYANAVGTAKWNVQGGALPPGMTLNSSTGVLSGTCTKKGAYSFNARVQDSNTSDTLTLTVTVK